MSKPEVLYTSRTAMFACVLFTANRTFFSFFLSTLLLYKSFFENRAVLQSLSACSFYTPTSFLPYHCQAKSTKTAHSWAKWQDGSFCKNVKEEPLNPAALHHIRMEGQKFSVNLVNLLSFEFANCQVYTCQELIFFQCGLPQRNSPSIFSEVSFVGWTAAIWIHW